jgi:hypothetical protein
MSSQAGGGAFLDNYLLVYTIYTHERTISTQKISRATFSQ